MAWGTEMGSLVGNIKMSHRGRTQFVNDVKKDVKAIQEVVSSFLSASETSRKIDFKGTMDNIQGRIQKIQARVKRVRDNVPEFLAESESNRKAGFKETMGGIANDLDALRKKVESVRDEARSMLGDYASERKEAAVAWASLPERHAAPQEVEESTETPAPTRRRRKKKNK